MQQWQKAFFDSVLRDKRLLYKLCILEHSVGKSKLVDTDEERQKRGDKAK